MARASLTPTARGERVHSTGTHQRLDVRPLAEPHFNSVGRPTYHEQIDEDNEQASFERMMRTNRAAGL